MDDLDRWHVPRESRASARGSDGPQRGSRHRGRPLSAPPPLGRTRRVELHRAAPTGPVVIHHADGVLDVERAATDQVPSHRLNVDLDCPIAIGLGVAFAPAEEPLVGIHLHQQPVLAAAGMNEEGLDIGDLHGFTPGEVRYVRCRMVILRG